MADSAERIERITTAAEEFFGSRVLRVSAPGGRSRASLRLHLADRTVIASLRSNYRRTHLEAFVLRRLAPLCDDVPRCLGVVGKILFQSDVGARRLNEYVPRAAPLERVRLAEEAVAALMRIHHAARRTDLVVRLPHVGAGRRWIENVVNGVDVLAPWGGPIPASYDRPALMRYISRAGERFVKWDCRSGNAALGDDGRVRWFDFEYAGLRHGAEDLAWLLGDESWPLDPAAMLDVVEDALQLHGPPVRRREYLEYMSVYTVLHAAQRLALVMRRQKRRGWLAMEQIRRLDDAGIHPEFAAHLCAVAAFHAARSRRTAMLVDHFEAARSHFLGESGIGAA